MDRGRGEGTAQSGDEVHLRTFLIADVRGYTKFTNERGDEAAARLAARFADVVEEVVVPFDGQVVELRGDEALVVFTSARNALRAAVHLQERFNDEVKQHPDLPLRVGIGIDAGEAIPVKGGYRGGALNLAARLCSIAAPGEVFASEGAVHMARHMAGFSYRERGEVMLKGLPHPVKVIQVVPEGADPGALPTFTVHVTATSGLPPQPTTFIGREREVTGITGMLLRDDIRLLTLTGPGGTGKTRLALQAATEASPHFPAGAFFVSLAPLTDPQLVVPTIAETVGVKEVPGEEMLETLKGYLGDKHLLLVLDNFEHVMDACSQVGEMLATCRGVKVLVTSRASLNLAAEHLYAVPPLSVPDPQHLPDLAALSQYDAVALFLQRAEAAKAGFQITNDNAPAIAEICVRLDGLPLAIELAAARIKIFPPATLLQRLDNRLKFLTGGARDLPSRQQTLRGAIDWSYGLLDEGEKTLFARLSVFAGGCTIEAAEVVCNAEGDLAIDVLDGLVSLVEKSLIGQEETDEGEPRFVMLETIREYAAEKLTEGDEVTVVRRNHGLQMMALTEAARDRLRGPEQGTWLRRLNRDHDNIRAALQWAAHAGENEVLSRIVGGLWRFWAFQGFFREGNHWTQTAIQQNDGVSPVQRAFVLTAASMMAMGQREFARALPLSEEALRLQRAHGVPVTIAACLGNLGTAKGMNGAPADGIALLEESTEIFRALGREDQIFVNLNNIGGLARLAGDTERARRALEESLEAARRHTIPEQLARAAANLSETCIDEGDYERATALTHEALEAAHAGGYDSILPAISFHRARIATQRGEYVQAVRLFALEERLRGQMGSLLEEKDAVDRAQAVALIRQSLDEPTWDRLRGEIAALPLDDAMSLALGER